MENERSYTSGFFGLGLTAALSVVVLVGAIGWKVEQGFTSKDADLTVTASAAAAGHSGVPDNNPTADYAGMLGTGSAATSADPYSAPTITDNVASALASEYAALQANGTYDASSAAAVAQTIGENIKADVNYKTYAASDIKTNSDTSYAGMLAYRSALQTTLKPLMTSNGPELDLLTAYVQTNDPSYLTQLKQAADSYTLAAAGTANIVVPEDAVPVQIGILDAMQEFAATLNQMAASANDPFAEATLINTYMKAQTDMFTSFNDLYTYYKSKQQ